MADILTAVRSILTADATVAGLVSTRIYPETGPQRTYTYPAVVLRLVSEMSHHHLTGMSGLAYSRVQVDCYGTTRLSATALQNACREALQKYRGTSASVVIRDIVPDFGTSTYEPAQDGSDVGVYRHIRDYQAHYQESI